MNVPSKKRWSVTASSGDPRLAVDDRYVTTWVPKPSKRPWLKIDLGEIASLGGLEVYWGKQAPGVYGFKSSGTASDGRIFAERATAKADRTFSRSLPSPRASCALPAAARNRSGALEIVEINLYGPADAASVIEDGRIGALGHSPVKLPPGREASRSISAMSALRSAP